MHSDLLHKYYNGNSCEVYIYFCTISDECYEFTNIIYWQKWKCDVLLHCVCCSLQRLIFR